MPINDPRDRFFYPHHTPMKDAYNHISDHYARSKRKDIIDSKDMDRESIYPLLRRNQLDGVTLVKIDEEITLMMHS